MRRLPQGSRSNQPTGLRRSTEVCGVLRTPQTSVVGATCSDAEVRPSESRPIVLDQQVLALPILPTRPTCPTCPRYTGAALLPIQWDHGRCCWRHLAAGEAPASHFGAPRVGNPGTLGFQIPIDTRPRSLILSPAPHALTQSALYGLFGICSQLSLPPEHKACV